MPQRVEWGRERTGSFSSATQVAPGVLAPAGAIRFGYARSGGPGGQNVNKVNTKVEMWVTAEARRWA